MRRTKLDFLSLAERYLVTDYLLWLSFNRKYFKQGKYFRCSLLALTKNWSCRFCTRPRLDETLSAKNYYNHSVFCLDRNNLSNAIYELFSEILRVIDSLKLTAEKKVATPVDWKVKISFWISVAIFFQNISSKPHNYVFQSGDNCIVVPSLTDDDANKLFPKGFTKTDLPSGKGYLRYTPDPSK